jgi:hypothetical protein
MDKSLLGEFQLDWKLAGKSLATASAYAQWIEHLLAQHPEPSLVNCPFWRVGGKRTQTVLDHTVIFENQLD